MNYYSLIKFAESLSWAQNIISKELEMELKRDNFQISDQEYNKYLLQLKQALRIKRGTKVAQQNEQKLQDLQKMNSILQSISYSFQNPRQLKRSQLMEFIRYIQSSPTIYNKNQKIKRDFDTLIYKLQWLTKFSENPSRMGQISLSGAIDTDRNLVPNFINKIRSQINKPNTKTAESNQKAVALNMGIYKQEEPDYSDYVKFTVGTKTFYGTIKSKHNLYSVVQLMFQKDNAWRLADGSQNVSNSKLNNFGPGQIPSRLWDMRSGGGW